MIDKSYIGDNISLYRNYVPNARFQLTDNEIVSR